MNEFNTERSLTLKHRFVTPKMANPSVHHASTRTNTVNYITYTSIPIQIHYFYISMKPPPSPILRSLPPYPLHIIFPPLTLINLTTDCSLNKNAGLGRPRSITHRNLNDPYRLLSNWHNTSPSSNTQYRNLPYVLFFYHLTHRTSIKQHNPNIFPLSA